MSTKYLSTDDFLVGITGEAVDFEIKGLGTVQIRALEYGEIQRIDAESKGDGLQSALLMVFYALVQPKLSQENIAALQKAKPGVIQKLNMRIMELSGMSDEPEKNTNAPGDGS